MPVHKPAHGALLTKSGHVRPNKTARGMSDTADRGRHKIKDELIHLIVSGTTDKGPRLSWYTERTKRVCECCGERMQRRVLNDAGRRRLHRLRQDREIRRQMEALDAK